MNRKLVLIGGGGHCKSVLDAALKTKQYDEIVITDPDISTGTIILGCEVVGNDEMLPALKERGFAEAFVTVGSIENSKARMKLAEMAKTIGFVFPIIMDPSASVSDHASVGAGTFIGKNSVINSEAVTGEHCIINTGSIVEHECVIGHFSHISVGTVLCGNVIVGDNSFVGAGSTVIQGMKIGCNSIVGAGALVKSNLPDDCLAVGIPAKILD